MFKKVLTLMLVLLGMVTLAACGNTDDPDPDPVDELTTLEKISEAMDQLDLPGSASSDLTLITSGLHDVVISWDSDDTAVIANNGTVTIPLFTDGDQTVTVTASLTLDGETLTKTFDVDVLAATAMSDQEKADLAAIAFNGLYSGSQMADLTLPATGLHATTVTWVSDNTDVVANDGAVSRPSFETGNIVVVITGTVVSGDATATVTITVTIVAEGEVNTYASIAAIYASAVLDEEIEFTGIITSTFNGGYFLTDGTDVLGVYAGNNDFVVVKGDEVKVKGAYAVYNSLYQLSSISSAEVLSSGNAIAIMPIETTIAGLLALDSNDATIHGKYYTVTATVGLFGDYNNVVLIDGEDQVMVYYQSDPTSLDALEAEVGKEVTVTVFYYTDHSRDGVIVAYDNGAEGIGITVLTDEEALAADIAALAGEIPGASTIDVMLPTEGPNGSVYMGWTSHNPALLGNDGTLMGIVTENTTVEFSVTVVKGNEMQVVSVEVMLTPMNTPVADLLAMDLGTYGNMTGIVYELAYYGFYVVDDGAYIFVKMNASDYTVVVGDEVTILGKTGIYNGLVQIVPMDDVITVDSQGNADPVVTVMGTVEGLQNDVYARGSRVTVTAMVVEITSGDYTNTYLQGVAGGQVQVYYRSNAGELATFIGQTVTLTVVSYHNELILFQGVAADVTVGGTYTDATTAQAVADGIDLGMLENLNMNLVLPADSTDPVATITWETSDAMVIDATGVITMVAGSNPMATLTATVTVGTEVVTRDFMVSLMDLDDNTPMPVADALLISDGNTVLVKGVVTGGYYGERIIQDSTGAAIWVDTNIDGELGDEIIVLGTLATYIENGNNNRQLDNATKLETVSTGNATVIDPLTDVAAIFAEKELMKRYTATFTITNMDSFGYVLFNTTVVGGEDEGGFKLHKSTYAPFFDGVFALGETVEVTFTAVQVHYANVQMGYPVVTVTDAELLAAAVAEVSMPDPVTTDLNPMDEIFGVGIVWSSSDEAVIALDGTVTRPATGAGDATVTLTAVFTIGMETQTETYVVTVSEDAPPMPDLFFSEYAEADGGSCKYVEIYNPTGAAVDLTAYAINKASNGGGWGTALTLSGTLNAGEVVVVAASACTNLTDSAQVDGNPAYPLTGITEIQWGSASWNGDDAVGLFKGGTIIDVIGTPDTDPGTHWAVGNGNITDGETRNCILIRVPSVMYGSIDWTAGAMEWIVATDDKDFSTVGTHTVNP